MKNRGDIAPIRFILQKVLQLSTFSLQTYKYVTLRFIGAGALGFFLQKNKSTIAMSHPPTIKQ
jgi:hypothetical protein